MAKIGVSSSALATMRLADLASVAKIMREHGEELDPKRWLLVLANILSSVERRDAKVTTPSICRRLSYSTLSYHAEMCGVGATDEEIRAQIAETRSWREALAADGRPFRPAMSADTIGGLLGVTDEVRAEAAAWNIGTLGGSRAGRARAKQERKRLAETLKRRSEGVMNRKQYEATSISRAKPWEADGVSRSVWYSRRQKAGPGSLTPAPRIRTPEPLFHDAPIAGGLAEKALKTLHKSAPPRDYGTENARVIAARAARKNRELSHAEA